MANVILSTSSDKDISTPSPCNAVFQSCTFADPNLIVLARFQQYDYVIYLPLEDRRNCRSVVQLISNFTTSSTNDLAYNSIERIGHALTTALVTEAYNRIFPIARNMITTSNINLLNPMTDLNKISIYQERSMFLHSYVLGYDNATDESIENIQPNDNEPLPWVLSEMNKIVNRIETEIEGIRLAYEQHGLTVVTRNSTIDLYLIRHGETDWNIQKLIQGHTNIPLNKEGVLQADELRKKLASVRFSRTFSSDLTRARSTAEIVLGSNSSTIIETHLLRERCWGTWEGRFGAELKSSIEQSVDLDRLNRDDYLSFKWDSTSESYADAYQRLQCLIRSIILSSSTNDEPILFSSHGGMLRAVLYYLDFHPEYRWQVTNCSFLKLRAKADGHITLLGSEGIRLVPAKELIFSF